MFWNKSNKASDTPKCVIIEGMQASFDPTIMEKNFSNKLQKKSIFICLSLSVIHF